MCFVVRRGSFPLSWIFPRALRLTPLDSSREDVTSEVCRVLSSPTVSISMTKQCWCGVNPDLTKNGEETSDSECNMDCAGSTTGEKCGGYLRISAYEMIDDPDPDPSHYVGCYADMRNRAMPAAGRYTSASMTNMVRCVRRGCLAESTTGRDTAELYVDGMCRFMLGQSRAW